MKLLKRQPGLPFLLSLGVLFILSASFLAVQLWSDENSLRGAAAALETPVMPPSLNMPKVVPPPMEMAQAVAAKKDVRKAVVKLEKKQAAPARIEKLSKEPAKVVEVKKAVAKTQEVKVAPVVKEELVKKAETSVVAKEEKKIEKPEVVAKAAVVEAKKAEPKPAPKVVSKPAPKATPKSSPQVSIKVVSKPAPKVTKKVNSEPKKAMVAPKAKPAKRRRAVKEDISQIPPEWNWFSKPLKVEMNEGRVEIKSIKCDPVVSKPRKLSLKAVKIEIKEDSIVNKVMAQEAATEKEQVVAVKKVVAKPFQRALAKLRKNKARREAQASKRSLVLPSQGNKRKMAPCLVRLNDMVKMLRNTSKSAVKENTPAVEVVSPVVEDNKNETIAVEGVKIETPDTVTVSSFNNPNTLDNASSYKGSGSGFSMRIQELIRSGAWLRNVN